MPCRPLLPLLALFMLYDVCYRRALLHMFAAAPRDAIIYFRRFFTIAIQMPLMP